MYKKKFTIIITGENKESFLINSINSCLNQSFTDFEIILTYSYLRNINLLKNKYKNKVIFKKIYHKKKNSTQDQFYKIQKSLEIASGELIVLLDGDDLILRNKLKEIAYNNFHKLLVHDYLNNYYKKKILVKFNKKKNSFTNFFFNSQWPKNFCTSSIVISHKSLKLFFKKIKNKIFCYVAIDALLIIFYKKNISYKKKILTIKNDDPNSVDKFFLGFLNKFFWLRRKEQHNFYNNIHINNKKNFDYFISLFLAKFFSYF